jgi:hypothetical protein
MQVTEAFGLFSSNYTVFRAKETQNGPEIKRMAIPSRVPPLTGQ